MGPDDCLIHPAEHRVEPRQLGDLLLMTLTLCDVHEHDRKLTRCRSVGKHLIMPPQRRRIVLEMVGGLAGDGNVAVFLDPAWVAIRRQDLAMGFAYHIFLLQGRLVTRRPG